MIPAAVLAVVAVITSCRIFYIPVGILIAGIILWYINKKAKLNILVLIYFFIYLISLLRTVLLQNNNNEITNLLKEKTYVQVDGTVTSITSKTGYYSIVLEQCVINIHNNDQKDNVIKTQGILVTSSDAYFCIGDRIQVTGQAECFEHARNEGCFDALDYYYSIGVYCKVKCDEYTLVKQDRKSLLYWLSQLRKQISENYKKIADEKEAGIYSSMVLGDKSELDEEIKSIYQINGIAHLLAISGLHISLMGMTVYRLLRKTGVGIKISFIAGSIMIFSYGIFTGNAVSSVRAVIMCFLMMTADILGRTYDLLTAAATVMIIMIIKNPYVIKNSGFLLSFGAVTAIGVIYPLIDDVLCTDKIISAFSYKLTEKFMFFKGKKGRKKVGILKKMIKTSISALYISVSVNIVTMPIILNTYYTYPLYSIFLNCIVIPLMTFLMMSAVFAAGSVFFNVGAGMFLIAPAHFILIIYDKFCDLTARLPFAYILTGKPEKISVIIYYLLIVALYLFITLFDKKLIHQKIWLKKNAAKIKFIYMVLTFSIAISILTCVKYKGFEVDMVDVGQGDGIFLRTEDNMVLLFDGGSTDKKNLYKNILKPFLQSKGVKSIDYALISHSDKDHYSGVVEIIKNNDIVVKNIVIPRIDNWENDINYVEIISLAKEYEIPVIYINAGEFFCSDGFENNMKSVVKSSVSIRCIHPVINYQYESTNDYSSVYYLKYKNFKMLFTGDAQNSSEKKILCDNLLQRVDVLKIGHHGSETSTSTEFLEKCLPKTAVISCGVNNKYGHPSPSITDRLKNYGIDTHITASVGQIIIRSDGKTYTVRNMLN